MSPHDLETRAHALIDRVKSELTPIWLGNRQRVVLEDAIAAELREVEREQWNGLKVTNEQLQWALKELGRTGTNAEAYIKAAVVWVIQCRAQGAGGGG